MSSALAFIRTDYLNEFIEESTFNHWDLQKISDQVYLIKNLKSNETPVWCQALARHSVTASFSSISEAQSLLLKHGKVWSYFPIESVRRGALIGDKIRLIKAKKWQPFSQIPNGPLGVFSLLNDKTLIFSEQVLPPIPVGSLKFQESSEPPSRAYLKIWEAFSRLGHWPSSKDCVLELGSSPGGWTWVLTHQLKCQVTCVDRGQMDPQLILDPQLKWIKQDAFSAVKDLSLNQFQWLLSDMACEPQKLLDLIKKCIQDNSAINAICTVKLTDRIKNSSAIIKEFKSIPNSKVIHLNSNKHELTWIHSPSLIRDSSL